MPSVTLVCTKCGKKKRETDFFKMKSGGRCDICKACLTMYIDNHKPDTFLWILEKFDVPYIEKVWIQMCNRIYLKDPAKFGPMSVIGQYLRTMNMSQYADYCFADSNKINFENEKAEREAQARRESMTQGESFEENLKSRLDNGEITESEYNTLSSETASSADLDKEIIAPPTAVPVSYSVREEEIQEELTEEDIKYLALKWGILYKPTEWLKMEELYQKYATENELNTDRAETLKKICKTSLKMDQALDVGDIQGYKNLSIVYDQLRKSAKFTEAQNKEEQTRDLDSIGELVAYVEKEGGAIPNYAVTDETEDKVDFIIQDLQNYINNLVRNELGLGDLIESFIEKEDKRKEETVEDIIHAGFKTPEEQEDDITEEDVMSFTDFYMQEIEEQSQKLADEYL